MLRPATRADFDQLLEEPLPNRVKAVALEQDGKLVAIGGFSFQPGDVIAAFLIKVEGVEKCKIALHKAGLHMMSEARRLGYRRVVATAEAGNPAAEPWLARCGFRKELVDGESVWIWTN